MSGGLLGLVRRDADLARFILQALDEGTLDLPRIERQGASKRTRAMRLRRMQERQREGAQEIQR